MDHPLKSVTLEQVEAALGESLSALVGARFRASIARVELAPPQEGRLSQRFTLELTFQRPVEDWVSTSTRE